MTIKEILAKLTVRPTREELDFLRTELRGPNGRKIGLSKEFAAWAVAHAHWLLDKPSAPTSGKSG